MISTDFLVIGSGIAGLIYSLDASKYGDVTIICKNNPHEGNTNYAQGGIASVTDSNDSVNSHVKDTLVAGAGLCNEEIVKLVVSEGPSAISHLVNIGTHFDKNKEGKFTLGQEGGHSDRRILHFGDSTGAEIQRALLDEVSRTPNIKILTHHLAIDFIQGKDNEVNGCYVLNLETNKAETIGAKITYLASGGVGKVYLYTTNPDVATGDGLAMAYRAGAEIRNMEFIQFHPTCLFHPHAKNFLITEAMRGEGGRLINRAGYNFMKDADPRAELASRDIVARAIDKELKTSGEDCVYLDISHKDKDYLTNRFPTIYKKLLSYGIDLTKEPIPVVPAAHYSCGGVWTDDLGRTSLPNLLSAGEVACTGLHGANRLASNSLLEAVVFARRAATYAQSIIANIPSPKDLPQWDDLDTSKSEEEVLITHSWDEVRRTMWNLVGIVRSTDRLLSAKRRIEFIKQENTDYYWKYKVTKNSLELRNIIDVALLIIDCSLSRKESRGLHYLVDNLELDHGLDGVDTVAINR